MSQTFSELCAEVIRSAKFVSDYEQCSPHFQRVLDFILSHPGQRDELTQILCEHVENGGYTEIALVEFLMGSLRWPEVRDAAVARCEREGNMYHEVKQLVDVYVRAAQPKHGDTC